MIRLSGYGGGHGLLQLQFKRTRAISAATALRGVRWAIASVT
jgi:hypothetical protein